MTLVHCAGAVRTTAWLYATLLFALVLRQACAGPSVTTGYLPTTRTQSQLFYWCAESTADNAPLIVWLQGGPGCSGALGFFLELGPYKVNSDMTLAENPYAWTNVAHLLVFDQPVGTGYSYDTKSFTNTAFSAVTDIPSDEVTVAADLFNALKAFYSQNPKMLDAPLWVAGESYAGKYVPYLASKIINESASLPLPFQGIAMGNAWVSPLEQTSIYASQASALGLVDFNEKAVMEGMIQKCNQLVAQEEWLTAANVCDDVLNYIVNASGIVDEDDVRQFVNPHQFDLVTQYLNLASTKKMYGVPDFVQWEVCSDPVFQSLREDEMKDAKHLIPGILDHVKVLTYNGNFDLNCGTLGTETWLRSLPWSGQQGFNSAKKCLWKVDGSVAGYARSYGALTHVAVANAGHLVPHDQPVNALDLITRFIRNQPYC
jgi:carboxypeptidase C (cathepsin A)